MGERKDEVFIILFDIAKRIAQIPSKINIVAYKVVRCISITD